MFVAVDLQLWAKKLPLLRLQTLKFINTLISQSMIEYNPPIAGFLKQPISYDGNPEEFDTEKIILIVFFFFSCENTKIRKQKSCAGVLEISLLGQK